MSRYLGMSQHVSRPDTGKDSYSHTSCSTPTLISRSTQSAVSTRCSRIKAELDAVNAELESIRSGQQDSTGSVVSRTSKASSLRPQDSISSISSRRGSIASRSHGSKLSIPSRHTEGSSRSASRSGRPYTSRPPSTLSRISEQSSFPGTEPGRTICRYQPPGSLAPAALSSVSGSQCSGSGLSLPGPRSFYQPTIRCRADGSYYDTKLKVSFEIEERSPDMYGCINNGLKLNEDGEYDIQDDLALYRHHH